MRAIRKREYRRQRRKRHVRKNVSGTPERPRLTVHRTHKNIYAQIIDDTEGRTLVSASTMETPSRDELEGHGGNRQAAKVVGKSIAAKALEAGIKRVVFDRNGYLFHGRIRELADAAREGGLQF